MSTLVTVELTLRVTVPIDDDDPDRAMDIAETSIRSAFGDIEHDLQSIGADDVVLTLVEALETEEI